ncbi:MAG: aminoglycoside 6-adenylyltransferase [Chloroflexota bacterium]
MTVLFSQRRRVDVLDKLTAFFSADSAIAGLVLVGSSADTITDDFSGLDFLVVVSNGAVFPSVYRKWKYRLRDIFDVAYEYEAESGIDRASYAMMLSDYLEVTFFFTPYKSLVVHRRPWHIIFDQTASEDLSSTLQARFRTERIVGPARTYQLMVNSIWQPILKCVAALNRNEIWRALHMLERIRHQTIELAALNHDLDMRHYNEVDQLPDEILTHMAQTMPNSTNRVAIREALLATTHLFFRQAEHFEERLQFKMVEDVRDRMLAYINAHA